MELAYSMTAEGSAVRNYVCQALCFVLLRTDEDNLNPATEKIDEMLGEIRGLRLDLLKLLRDCSAAPDPRRMYPGDFFRG